MSIDPFSDVLRLTEARSVVSGGFAAGGEWALRFPPPEKIKFFAVTKGSCWLRLDGEKRPSMLEQGDVFLVSGRRGFLLASDLATAPRDARRVFGPQGGTFVRLGDGSEFAFLGGHVSLHPSSGGLLSDVLPALVLVRAASPQAAMLRWILEHMVQERSSTLPGARAVAGQLAQLMFVQALRAHLAGSGALPAGWLRAMGDDRIAPALRSMHGDPRRAWTLSELAKAAAMSRSSFAERFRSVAGIAPLTYLTEWRMHLARRALRDEAVSVLQLAESLGYSSESAFSNAFKRVTGTSPRNYRKAARLEPAAAEMDDHEMGPQASRRGSGGRRSATSRAAFA
jgi:AraC-like DNA-binding protein